LPYREKIFVYERILMKFSGSIQQPKTYLLCEFDENREKLAKTFLSWYISTFIYALLSFFYQASPLFFSLQNYVPV